MSREDLNIFIPLELLVEIIFITSELSKSYVTFIELFIRPCIKFILPIKFIKVSALYIWYGFVAVVVSMTVNEVSIVPEAYSSVSDSIALNVVVPTPTIVNIFSLTVATNVLELV